MLSKLNRSLHLYWFSASGNTHIAAVAFAERLRQLGWNVELRPLERSDPQAVDPYATLGFAFPTHCFTIPEIVLSFVQSLPQCHGTDALMLGTHGGGSGGVLGPLKRKLTAKGFHCIAGSILCMPTNFFPFASQESNKQRIDNALIQAARYADDLDAGKTSWSRWPIVSDVYAACWRYFFASRKLFRKYFTTIYVNRERCTRCGVCVRYCPVRALEQMDDSLPCITKKCINCLRCVSVCPNDAMRHSVGQRSYRCEAASLLQQRFESLERELRPAG